MSINSHDPSIMTNPSLFQLEWEARHIELPLEVEELAQRSRLRRETVLAGQRRVNPGPGQDLLELFERASNPTDIDELVRLFLSRVNHRASTPTVHGHVSQIEPWESARPRRTVTAEEVMTSPAAVGLVKELFNVYFRDDLYGRLRHNNNIILSSGAVDEELFGLPGPLRDCIRYALQRDWYGYSDSRGRDASREALARYESARMQDITYDVSNVCIGLGGTAIMAGIADMVLTNRSTTAPAVCGIPNYPPLVQAVARRGPVVLAAIPEQDGLADLTDLIAVVDDKTPLVLIQTALNPTGARVTDHQIKRLMAAVGRDTVVVLDECHEWLGQVDKFSSVRADPRVVRVNSVSKNWSAPGLKVGWLIASATFVGAFYEYSSTTYGGPASIFYTMTEVIARMERWSIEGHVDVGLAEMKEFELSYELDLSTLQRAYREYTQARHTRASDLALLRDASCQLLYENGGRLLDPTYSINAAVDIGEGQDGYVFFRNLLHQSGVSVFPGILTFVLSQDLVRITSARSWHDLSRGLPPLAQLAARLSV
jgi:aspartate/methionine/tyrosine aminotransferase